MYFDREEARNEETSAMSRGSPKSPRGIWDMKLILTCDTGSVKYEMLNVFSYLVRHHVSHGSLDEARQDDVHPDTELAQLLGRRLSEADDCGLAGGVVCLANVTRPGHDAGDVDDGAGQLVLLHQTGRRLQDGKQLKGESRRDLTWVTRKVPFRLTSITLSKSSSFILSRNPSLVIPAELTMISGALLYFSITFWKHSLTESA